LLGLLSGLLLTTERGFSGGGVFWSLLAVAAFALGVTGGLRVWRPTAFAVVGIVLAIFITRAVM
jgi:hypothetical protein